MRLVIVRMPLVVPLAALAGFGALLVLVVCGWAPLHEADTALSDAFRAYGVAHPDVVRVLRVVTDVGATVPFCAAGAAVTVLFAVRRDRRRAAFTALVTVAVPVLWSLMHLLITRPRPVDGFVVVGTNGFPSGHTSNAAAAALVAVFLGWPVATTAVRVGTVVLAAAFAVFIGLTRAALLAHWPTDVLGGWLLALAVVPLLARVAQAGGRVKV
jgi:membrane-associated phospholipid phosphatase